MWVESGLHAIPYITPHWLLLPEVQLPGRGPLNESICVPVSDSYTRAVLPSDWYQYMPATT